MKYGISFTEQITLLPRVTKTTVMQFGYTDKIKALRVIDKSSKNIDPVYEALAIFEYTDEREHELEIGELLPYDIQTIPVNLNDNPKPKRPVSPYDRGGRSSTIYKSVMKKYSFSVPNHMRDWLRSQPDGLSVTIRKIISIAMKSEKHG